MWRRGTWSFPSSSSQRKYPPHAAVVPPWKRGPLQTRYEADTKPPPHQESPNHRAKLRFKNQDETLDGKIWSPENMRSNSRTGTQNSTSTAKDDIRLSGRCRTMASHRATASFGAKSSKATHCRDTHKWRRILHDRKEPPPEKLQIFNTKHGRQASTSTSRAKNSHEVGIAPQLSSNPNDNVNPNDSSNPSGCEIDVFHVRL